MNTGDPKLDARSKRRLLGVNPKLAALISLFAEHPDHGIAFIVTEGVRSLERQKELVAAGASRTLNSKHLTGRAVDIAIYVGSELKWTTHLYQKFGKAFKLFAESRGVGIVWGGDWRTFKDYVHFELKDSE